MIYLGIDPTAGRRPLNYALLDGSLALLAEGECQTAELLKLIAPYPDIVCAVDAPSLPNKGLMADPAVRARLGLPPHTETWAQYRVCEYKLRRQYQTLQHPRANSKSANLDEGRMETVRSTPRRRIPDLPRLRAAHVF
ncbi:MAG: hypothetical protein AAB427_00830 [Chloroflexota bacterium]